MPVYYQKISASRTVTNRLLTALVARRKDFSWFGGTGSRWIIVPLLTRKSSWQEFEHTLWRETAAPSDPIAAQFPFTSGFIGVIPYEQFTTFRDGSEPLLQAADAALLFDQEACELFIASDAEENLSQAIDDAKALLSQAYHAEAVSARVSLTPLESNESYEQKVAKALSDIRSGRFYQINLLRYFTVNAPNELNLATLLASRGGPWSAWIRQGNTDVISFSPEQFTSITENQEQWLTTTRPIKGTAPRDHDPLKDRRNADALTASAKDRAELHMIIDLMRNDLTRICTPGSVTVTQSAELQSFINVHHLVGSVEGRLERGTTINQFLAALCPAGSITGAPKIEVMQAIREAEGRPRGYFMGNAFILDRNGRFDSSVLIRTIVGTREDTGNKYEFSAGSGIVVSSDPRSERLEIDAKCNVLFPEE